MGKNNLRTVILLVVFLGCLPLLIRNDYYLSVLIFIGINTITVMGLSLLMGYAGQLSMGHAAFFGIGAYCTGVFPVKYGFPIPVAFLCGIFLSAVMAMAIAIPTLKLKGHYLAVATLGFGEIINIIFNELLDITGGPNGLSSIPYITFWGHPLKGVAFYYFVWAVVILLLIFALNIIHSRIGRALRAIRGSDVAATAMGLDVSQLKVQIFVLSAVYASIGGSLYAHFVTFISPTSFGLFFSTLLLMMVIIGGLSSIWGALLGAAILTVLPEYLRAFSDFDILVYGVVLMVILLFMQEGIFKGLVVSVQWVRKKW